MEDPRENARYSLQDQNSHAHFFAYNYTRRNTVGDPAFRIIDKDHQFEPSYTFPDVEGVSREEYIQELRNQELSSIRDNIASSLKEARQCF